MRGFACILAALAAALAVGGASAASSISSDDPEYEPGDELFVTLVLNEQPKGEIFAVLDAEGLWIRVKALEKVGATGVEGRTRSRAGEDLVLVGSLSNAKSVFDEAQLRLLLDIAPELLAKQVVDLSSEPSEPLSPEPAVNGYLNWTLDRQETPGARASGGTLALNLRAAGWWLRSDHDWLENRDPAHIRFGTALTRDWPEPAVRLTLGDAQVFSGELGRARSLAGIGFARAFQLQPGFQPSPAASLSTSVSRPSVAEIYVDGVLLRSVNLNPGTVDFSNLRYFTGLRNTEVVIRDNFGNRSVFDLPFYFTNEVLDQGLHDFSYHAGLERPDTTRERYDRLAFSAYHRYGVTDRITVGARGDGVRGTWSAGPTLAVRVPRAGVLSASWSRSGGADLPEGGTASAYGWNWNLGGFTASVLARRFSEFYAFDPALGALSIAPIRRNASASASQSLPGLGTVSLSGEQVSYWGAPEERRATLGYSLSLFGRLSASLSVSRLTGARTGTEGALTVSYSFTDRLSATYTRQRNAAGESTDQARLTRSLPVGEGWGSTVYANRSPSLRTVEATGDVNLPALRLGVAVRHDQLTEGEGTTAWRAAVGGSLAFATGGGWHLTRPIDQSFAVVKVGKIADVAVLEGNQVLGRTNADGVLMAPDVNSLSPTSFVLRDGDIPLEYTLVNVMRRVLPPQNAGLLVNFGVKRIHALTGSLVIDRGEKRIPVDNRLAQIWSADVSRPRDMPVGKDGLFYLDDIVPGAYLIAVRLPEGQCSVRIDLPEHDDPAFDVGEIACEIEAGS